MDILSKLQARWSDLDYPFLIHPSRNLHFSDIIAEDSVDLTPIRRGDVVALIGDFEPLSISTLLRLIEKDVILVPLTVDTRSQHDYFFETAMVNVVVEGTIVKRINEISQHLLLDELKTGKNAGLILFSSGTTGRPKAILHDLSLFMKRFETPRPTLKTINFLLFDHIGGLNTLLHTLFNKGSVVVPLSRSVEDVLKSCREHDVEVLPTTPTFLRMMLISGLVPDFVPESLSIISYGTERMDQHTLDALCKLLPNIDFRQTFGMSELGIVRVKSEARDSLFMKIGGEGVETRVVDNVLQIRSNSRMLGYLNAASPFDKDGWYDSKDIVEEKDGLYKVTGRTSEVINVGGLKFMAAEVELVALEYPDVAIVKAYSRTNPITGQHVEIIVEPTDGSILDKGAFKSYLNSKLQSHMIPKRIKIEKLSVGHRFKKT
jgi:long-chain acyl-CoA synthetase